MRPHDWQRLTWDRHFWGCTRCRLLVRSFDVNPDLLKQNDMVEFEDDCDVVVVKEILEK